MELKPSIKSEKTPWLFIIISLLLWVTIFIVDEINATFHHSDFSVYYQAAQALLNADQIYGIVFPPSTIGFYKYSPTILIFFIPFLLLPYKIASFVYVFLLTVSFIIFTNNLYNLYRTRFFDRISVLSIVPLKGNEKPNWPVNKRKKFIKRQLRGMIDKT